MIIKVIGFAFFSSIAQNPKVILSSNHPPGRANSDKDNGVGEVSP